MSCFTVTRSKRITIAGLREHPWLAMDGKGLKEADLTETRKKIELNFKGKFKKAANTVRATLRMKSLTKLTADLSAAKELRLKTDSGGGGGDGGNVGTSSGMNVFNSIDEVHEEELLEEEEEEEKGRTGGGVKRGGAVVRGSAKKYAAPSSSTNVEE